ncbi:hypothetical protein DFH06DRAFT_1235455 [Mycena polygramma]|nr:hypothetical protein DFH06DRAFT_1235455 [Mycena polygramma]
MTSTMTSSYVLPGQPIPVARGAPVPQIGSGIYVRDSELRASLVGIPQQEGPLLSVSRRVRAHPPAINAVILGSVIRLSPLQATLSISVVDGVPLPAGEEFTGVIRSQDVRATEKDRVKIGDSFRGGDVVRGVVVTILFTTARNDLGVVFAVSEAGKTMVPVSWKAMRCPESGKVEPRKCAKPE